MSAKDANVGKDTEQRLARYFQGEGWPDARRLVRTGFRNAHTAAADEGDLSGLPGLCVQSKSLRPHTRAEVAVPGWLLEVEQQREASRATLGLLVVRRWGTTDVGRWWCFLTHVDLFGLMTGLLGSVPGERTAFGLSGVPVRLELRDVVTILKAQGWQQQLAVAG